MKNSPGELRRQELRKRSYEIVRGMSESDRREIPAGKLPRTMRPNLPQGGALSFSLRWTMRWCQSGNSRKFWILPDKESGLGFTALSLADSSLSNSKRLPIRRKQKRPNYLSTPIVPNPNMTTPNHA